ncbi:actin interacting protein 3-domain-containing protein [Leucosporidium creatinivorum]|uniref:Actin interacting protein 3-domain-containing protein n=1 Tax=Leucosporidium creatinivorum TaxID=106004 RepID=A0A1Y2F8N7_9BASI|nr:actin interacting protein 3-domain-containing protein [Leucosporidium creatinivorum]
MATPNNGQQQPRSISPTASTSAQPYDSTAPAAAPPQRTASTSQQQRQRPSMSSSGSSGSVPNSHMESTITRLLVATKQLLEGLAKWSRGEVGEDVISEIYVKLGNDFNVACSAFAKENIGMNELLSVPSDLRICLETCLSDTPSQATLEKHLPKVRQIIIGLLHGLREKQRLYRDGAAARRVKETQERERERDRIKEMARSGELVRSGSMSGPSSGSAGGAASQARMQLQQQQQQQGQKDPLTPNSAQRSRDDLRKFVTQAKASAMPMVPPSTTSSSTSTRTVTPQPVYPSSSSSTTLPTSSSTSNSTTATESNLPPSSSSSSASSFVSTTSTSNGTGGRYDDALPPSSSSSNSLKQSTRPSRTNPNESTSTPTVMVRDSAVPIVPPPSNRLGARTGGGSMREKERESSRPSRSAVSEGGQGEWAGAGAGATLPHSKSSSSLASSLGNVNFASGGGGGARPTSGEKTRAYSPPPPPREVEDPGPVPLTPTFATSPTPSFQSRQLGDALASLRPSSALSSHSTTAEDPSTTPAPPPPLTPTTTLEASQSAAQLQSLEALKASDNLSRRASKRYSAYTIQKMTSPLKEGPSGGGGGGSRGERLGRVGEEIRRAGSGSSAGREWADGERKGSRLAGGDGVRRTKSEFRPMREDGSGGGGRRGVPPPLPAMPASLSAGSGLSGLGLGGGGGGAVGLGVGTIVEEEGSSREGTPDLRGGPPSFPPPPVPTTASTSPISTIAAPAATEPPSTSPTVTSTVPPPSTVPAPPQSARSSLSTTSPLEPSFPLSIFLQLGRDVKKVKLTSPPTHATLRQLFVERFQYNPGASGEFPAIYLKDREVGVHYELEEVGEVREGSLLSLNIDDVQQVKQHIDQGLLALAQEMKELKTTVTAMRRVSVSANTLFSPEPSSHLHASTSSPVIRASPSERQFQDAAQKVIRMRRLGSTNALVSPSPDAEPLSPKSDLPQPPTTSTSTLPPPITTAAPISTTAAPAADTESLLSPTRSDAYTSQVVSTLKTQHSEVQNLRRDISVLRQIYVDFASQTKDMMAATRVQTSHVATLAAKKISQERKFVEAGTSKLEAESTDLVVKVDELQDTIDQIRMDTVRGIRARPSQLSELGVALNKATKERQEMLGWVAKVKPSWATTWSEELQVVLTEQALVQDKEALLRELGDDLDEVKSVLKNIETVSKQSNGGKGINGVGGGGGGGRPNPRTFDFGGNDGSSAGGSEDGQAPAFLLEVRGLRPDPQRRLDAIARAEKQREADLASRTDEFTEELGGFVAGGKLKKSGGIGETERLRQARSEATLKAMFSS